MSIHVIAKPIGSLCNLDCVYCYYKDKVHLFGHSEKSTYIMSNEILETFIKQYINAQPEETQEINFTWQGGEPTILPLTFFDKAVFFQRKYKRTGMRITNTLQTNATLITEDWAQWLVDNDFLVGVSIDGDEQLHNSYRQFHSGDGTYGKVMAGLNQLKSVGAAFNTLTVVHNNNADFPERIYDFLLGLDVTFMQFIPLVVKNNDSMDIAVSPKQWGCFLIGLFNHWIRKQHIGSVFIQYFDIMLGIYCGHQSSLCVNSPICGKSVALEHDGSLFSCDHYVNEEHVLGNILDDNLNNLVSSQQQVDFGNKKWKQLPDECHACRWLAICHGGCLKDRIVGAKGGFLNYLCEGYKSFYNYSAPFFQAMALCLQYQIAPSRFREFFVASKDVARNAPCPCLSGKKFKHCHRR